MKHYYLVLSRLSLAVIVLQTLALIHCGFRVEKFNRGIDDAIGRWSQPAATSSFLEPFRKQAAERLALFQQRNRENHWVLRGIVMGGGLHLAIAYSLYLHFLRLGCTWTKLCLHANNLSVALPLPFPGNLLWWFVYLIGTRVCKHCCLAATFSERGAKP